MYNHLVSQERSLITEGSASRNVLTCEPSGTFQRVWENEWGWSLYSYSQGGKSKGINYQTTYLRKINKKNDSISGFSCCYLCCYKNAVCPDWLPEVNICHLIEIQSYAKAHSTRNISTLHCFLIKVCNRFMFLDFIVLIFSLFQKPWKEKVMQLIFHFLINIFSLDVMTCKQVKNKIS